VLGAVTLDTWRGSREAFAEGVQSWEWALVDRCYSFVQRTIPMIRLGQPTSGWPGA
jgi:hypothetical protein